VAGGPSVTGVTSSDRFRSLFPALGEMVWLDTPACAPGATPVTEALVDAVVRWRDGRLAAAEWEEDAPDAREAFAAWQGVPTDQVATVGSVTEATATVAASLPSAGSVVVPDDEFRSTLFPWPAAGLPVTRVPTGPRGRTEALLAAIDETTALVAVSQVLSSDGERVDLARLRAACDEVGARLFVDATQSLGVLPVGVETDYLAVHGYKWMLCPRGAAWLVTRHHEELRPLLPGWKSAADGGYFGGQLDLAPGAARSDTSPAWLAWTGALAALPLLAGLPAAAVEAHCLGLAAAFRSGAAAAGAEPLGAGLPSHIVTVRLPEPRPVRARLRARRVRALLHNDRLRVGFHYFNSPADVDAVLGALTA
jgi:selenocysteine lyase/cysteine desulfurase